MVNYFGNYVVTTVTKMNVYCVGFRLLIIIVHCVKFILVKISD